MNKEEIEKMSIEDLELSVRSTNLLRHLGIKTVKDLTNITAGTLRSSKSCGKKSILEIRDRLAFYGLCLCGDIIIQSAAGIALVKEIPEMMEKLQRQVLEIKSQLQDLSMALDRIVLSETNDSQKSKYGK